MRSAHGLLVESNTGIEISRRRDGEEPAKAGSFAVWGLGRVLAPIENATPRQERHLSDRGCWSTGKAYEAVRTAPAGFCGHVRGQLSTLGRAESRSKAIRAPGLTPNPPIWQDGACGLVLPQCVRLSRPHIAGVHHHHEPRARIFPLNFFRSAHVQSSSDSERVKFVPEWWNVIPARNHFVFHSVFGNISLIYQFGCGVGWFSDFRPIRVAIG